MSGMVGADVAQVRALAASYERAAEQLRQTSTTVRTGIQISAWVGPFAVRFRRTWDSEHSVKLLRAATALASQARQLRIEADQQESASAARTATAYRTGPVSDRDLVDFARSGTSDQHAVSGHGYTALSDHDLRALGIDPRSLHDERSGFDAKVYRDGAGRIIVSFGGTEPTQGGDILSDVSGAVATSTQTQQTLALAIALSRSVDPDDLVFTGHSLGGRNAAIASVATGSRAVTFNAAGVSASDYAWATATGALNGRPAGSPVGVTNYFTTTDPLTHVQAATALPDAVGLNVPVGSSHWGLDAHQDFDAFREDVPGD